MRLRLRHAALAIEPGQPLLMGIVNASPDSFSDPGSRGISRLVERGMEQVRAGARLIDVGGESGRTDRAPISAREEIRRVVPVVERLAAEGVLVSVDTWRPPVARAALDAGAVMVNDVSALAEPALADACAAAGAALVITHTRLPPKRKGFPRYADVVEDVAALWRERAVAAFRRGMGQEQLVFDPGIDLAKTPAQSVALLRRLPELAAAGRLLLVAISRKDFLGALCDRPPSQRLGGTLAALGGAVEGGAAILRVHDVAAASDYLTVRAALRDELDVPAGLQLDAALRRKPGEDERAA